MWGFLITGEQAKLTGFSLQKNKEAPLLMKGAYSARTGQDTNSKNVYFS